MSSVKSGVGASFSLLLFIVLLAYSLQKLLILMGKGDTRVNSFFVPDYFDETYEFGYENGFSVAFGYYNVFDPGLIDKSYGEIEVFLSGWKLSEKERVE